MARRNSLPELIEAGLRRPLMLTWAGLWAERIARAFWPLWSLVAVVAGLLMVGMHDLVALSAVRAAAAIAGLCALWALYHGASRFRRPRRDEAVSRIDGTLPGRPLAALADVQAVGAGDDASEDLWKAHQARMATRAATARAVEPDLRLARRDPFGLRYVALMLLVVGLLFGSVWRVGTVAQVAPGDGADLTTGPAWEGWVEPPAYTGLPSLYLNDLEGTVKAPEGSRVTLRLYGEAGALGVRETVSGRADDPADGAAQTGADQSFDIRRDGMLEISGAGGREWDVVVTPDRAPDVEIVQDGARTTFDGQMTQPFVARDDHGVTGGTAIFRLDLDNVDRRHGLAAEPDPREPIELDLPMPITGDRAEFTESLVENLSQHPWAHLPVTLQLRVRDARDQAGRSEPRRMDLPARRFFDPLAAAVIEQRRDLLWSKSNGKRVTRVLRAVSHRPEGGLFRSETAYLRLRVILRRLDTLVRHDSLTDEAQEETAQALWDLAVLLEDGDIGDAMERMRQAQERLSEAMRNGASDEEIAQLMQELRRATEDYLRQKQQQTAREDGPEGGQQPPQDGMRMTQDDLQKMMDRIQELMEQGRMAEAEQALREFQQMMENMRVTEGQGQQGKSPGQEAMEGLADTLRQQQGLSDQAFRDLQEQFNPNAQAGESEGNEGRDGGLGRGESHQRQPGTGRGDGRQPGDGAQGSLADRQEALRRELERQRGSMPGAGTEEGEAARDSLDRAGRAMEGAEEALRGDDLAEALDQQSEAMEALREGMRNLGEAMADAQRRQQGGQGQARGQPGDQQSDPLGRTPGRGGQVGTRDSLLQGEDVYRRARELLDELRRRSGDGDRPDIELDYLQRLLDRF